MSGYPTLQVVERGLVFDAERAAGATSRRSQVAFFDGLVPLASGAWICGFTVGTRKHDPCGTIRLYQSDRTAQAWTPLPWEFDSTFQGVPGSLTGAEIVEVAPGHLLLVTTWFDRSDPDRPLFDPVTEGLLCSRLLLGESLDGGLTWSRWRSLETGDLTGVALTGPWLRWPDGTLGVAFESFKHFDDPRPARHAAWIVVSTDQGRSFGNPYLVAHDPNGGRLFWDQRLCVTDEPLGFWALFWTHDRTAQRDLNVHSCRGTVGGPSMRPSPTSMPGQIAAPCQWSDRHWLAFVVERRCPGRLTLWQSLDGGETWPAEQALVVYCHDEQARLTQTSENIDFKAYWEDMAKWSFGHPAIRPFDAQQLLVTFYAGTPEQMSVHWVRIAVDPVLSLG